MNSDRRKYGTNNVAHCFSRKVKFSELLNPYTEEEVAELEVDGYTIKDFMLGSSHRGKVKERQFYHIPLPLHFVIKHHNQGKIESLKWFFKGFCEHMQPKYAQLID